MHHMTAAEHVVLRLMLPATSNWCVHHTTGSDSTVSQTYSDCPEAEW